MDIYAVVVLWKRSKNGLKWKQFFQIQITLYYHSWRLVFGQGCVTKTASFLPFVANESNLDQSHWQSVGAHIYKVKKILKGSLDSISSPSPSVKIQIWAKKFAWSVKAKHCWALLTNYCIQKFVDNIQQWFAFTPFLPIIWIFTEGEGDGIESRLSS